MISKDKQYILRGDQEASVEERIVVEILSTDMGGECPVLFRMRYPRQAEWQAKRVYSSGRFSLDGESSFDLVELNLEETWLVIACFLSGEIALYPKYSPTAFHSKAEAEESVAKFNSHVTGSASAIVHAEYVQMPNSPILSRHKLKSTRKGR